MTEKTNEERIPRPEEILENQEDLTPEQKLQPLRCRAGSKTDNPCPRDATTWMHPEDRDYPLCDEHARAELAAEIADVPRKGCAERIANLTPEQDEELRQRITRSDGLNNAYTDLEDHAADKVLEKRLRRTLGVLVEEKERAAEEVGRYKEELGLR